MKVFELITEIIGWIRIWLSPTGFGLLLGGICYFNLDKPWGLVAGIALVSIGAVIGAVIATREWKRDGTMRFLAEIDRTPELDDAPNPQNPQ